MNIYYKIVELFQNFKYTNEHLKGNNLSYQKFIVLTYKRSGGNYFLDLLRSHPKIICYAGLFGGLPPAFVYSGYPTIQNKQSMKYRNKYPIEFLKKRVFRNFSNEIKAVGFKIVYETKYPIVLEYLKTLPDLKIINLQRRNLLRMYLSDVIASSTNTWHILNKKHEQFVKDIGAEKIVKIIDDNTKNENKQNIKVNLKYEDCLNEFNKIFNFIEEFKKYFKPEQLHIVYYEDILANFENETIKLQDFLGVEHYNLTSRFIKINNNNLSDVITNYSELKKQFAGSKWESFFED